MLNPHRYLQCLLVVYGCLFAVVAAVGGECEDPDTIGVVFFNKRQALNLQRQIPVLSEYLTNAIGKNIVFFESKSYLDTVKLSKSGQVHIVRLTPAAYIQSKKRQLDIEVFATPLSLGGASTGARNRSQLIVRGNSQFDTVDSLRGSRLALVDPGSATGYLVPNILFAEEVAMPLERYFDRILMSGDHNSSAKAVFSGAVDAAFVSSVVTLISGKSKPEAGSDFRVLWESPVLPREALTYRRSLCPGLKLKISTAILRTHLFPELKSFFEALGAVQMIAADDEDYSIIRRLVKYRADTR